MVTLALAALLAIEEPLPPPPPPPTPPPLLPSGVEPGTEPLYVPAPQTEHHDPDLTKTEDAEAAAALAREQYPNATGFNGSRVAVVGGVAGGTGALLVGGALFLMLNNKTSGWAPLVLLLSLPVSLFLGTGLGVAVHRGMDGLGGYGAHLGGGAIGGGLGLLVAGLVYAASNGNLSPAAAVGGVIGLATFFGIGTGLMSELSNWRSMREMGLEVGIAPLPGGAVASASMRF